MITSSSPGSAAFTTDGASFQNYIVPQAGGYYFLFRHLALLDQQREWYYDPLSATLYFWAPNGVDPATLDVRVKRRQWAFDLSSRSGVTLRGLRIFGAGVFMDPNSSGNTIASISASHTSQFTSLPDTTCPWQGCVVSPSTNWYNHLADTGIVLNGSNNVLQDSEVQFSAGNGVSVLGNGHTVRNNLIHHVAYAGNATSGIVLQGPNHVVANNTVHTVPRFAIQVTDVSFWPRVSPENIDIGYNNLYNCGMVARDNGCFYVGGIASSLSKIHHNWIHDTQTIYPGPASDFTLNALYFDEDTSGWSAFQNVIWNTGVHAIFLHGSTSGQTTPMDIYVGNNSIIDANPNAVIELQDVNACGSTQVVNNLTWHPVVQIFSGAAGPTCATQNNGPGAPGATEMTGVVPGCHLAGCSSNAPPATVDSLVAASLAYEPFDQSVRVGQAVTFVSIGNGSGVLSYQWMRDGVPIPGAVGPTYTLAPATLSDTGAAFSVRVNNAIGSAASRAAVLTVQ